MGVSYNLVYISQNNIFQHYKDASNSSTKLTQAIFSLTLKPQSYPKLYKYVLSTFITSSVKDSRLWEYILFDFFTYPLWV